MGRGGILHTVSRRFLACLAVAAVQSACVALGDRIAVDAESKGSAPLVKEADTRPFVSGASLLFSANETQAPSSPQGEARAPPSSGELPQVAHAEVRTSSVLEEAAFPAEQSEGAAGSAFPPKETQGTAAAEDLSPGKEVEADSPAGVSARVASAAVAAHAVDSALSGEVQSNAEAIEEAGQEPSPRGRFPLTREALQRRERPPPFPRESSTFENAKEASSKESADVGAPEASAAATGPSSTPARKKRVSLESGAAADPPVLWRDSRQSLLCEGVAECTLKSEGEKAASKGVFFVAVGDTGMESDGRRHVAARISAVAQDLPVSFVSLLGDNVYPSGVSSASDENFGLHFERVFSHKALQQVAFFPVLGNHDYQGDPQAQVKRFYVQCRHCEEPEDANEQGVRWRLPNAWYFTRAVFREAPIDLPETAAGIPHVASLVQQNLSSGDGGNAEGGASATDSLVVVNLHLDSNLWLGDEDPDGFGLLQWQFFRRALRAAQTDADWLFVHLHHPLASAGNPSRLSPRLRDRLLPLLFQFKVDALFAGHEHLISLFEFEEGGDKVPQIIVGSGAKLFLAKECCSPNASLVHCRAGSEAEPRSVPPCKDSRCKMQMARPGFGLVQLSKRRMRVLLVEAATGVVLGEALYGSKKKLRLANAADWGASLQKESASLSARPSLRDPISSGAAAVVDYPAIVRVALKQRDGPAHSYATWRKLRLWLLLSLLAVAICVAACSSRSPFGLRRIGAAFASCCRRVKFWRSSAGKGAVPLPGGALEELELWTGDSTRCVQPSRQAWAD